MNNWLVIRTRPRWEKKVAALLSGKGVEVYCPLVRVRRKWSDRFKVVEQPLLKAMVFVRISDAQRTDVRTTQGVMNFVSRNGKPAVIKEKVIQAIRHVQEKYPIIEVVETGACGAESELVDVKHAAEGKVVKLYLDGLGLLLMASSDSTSIAVPTDNN